MAKNTCPRCGAPIDPDQTTCQNCRGILKKKSALTPYLIIAGIAVVVVIVIAVLLMSPAPGAPTMPAITASPTLSSEESLPSQPPCIIGITGSKVSSSTIRLQVIKTTCSPGEVTGITVSIDGADKGTLGSSPGSSATFTGSLGTDSVIVTAKFANGAESVVYQNP